MNTKRIRSLILIALFASLTAVGAFIKIPMWPVAISLQFLFTALAGVLLGGRRAAASQAVYLMIGLIGIPVFTEGGGIGYLARPSFGFLLGLIPAAFVIGILSQKRNDLFRIAGACVSGLAVLYLFGLPYMYVAVNFFMGVEMSPAKAIYSGMVLFLPGDLLKIAIVAAIAVQIRKRLKKTLL